MKRRRFLQGLACLPLAAGAQPAPGPLQRLDAEFRRGRYPGVDGMVVLQGGRTLISAAYPAAVPRLQGPPGLYNYTDPQWHPLHQGLHTMQSITKSVLAALIGMALERGELHSVTQPVAPHFPEVRLDPKLTIQDLLTMQAGLAWNEDVDYSDPANDWAAMERSSDWLNYVLTRPVERKRFNYSSGVPILLAALLTRVTGQTIPAYAEAHLFRPLGIHNVYWKTTPTGLADTQGGLYLSTLDLAKFGASYLSLGSWARESFQPRVPAEDWQYGYQWWLLPHPRLPGQWVPTALGYGGQRLFLFPEKQLVAAFTGWNPGGKNSLPIEEALKILESLPTPATFS